MDIKPKLTCLLETNKLIKASKNWVCNKHSYVNVDGHTGYGGSTVLQTWELAEQLHLMSIYDIHLKYYA